MSNANIFFVYHQDWTGYIVLKRDGTFFKSENKNESGTWKSVGNKLSLHWKRWPTEILHYKNGVYTNESMTLREGAHNLDRISFCTTCKNRSHHLKETLPKSLEASKILPNREFIILDYNSEDDLEEWCKNNLQSEIKKGIVKYYKTTEPEFFHMSHAKNLSHRLATGKILCNLDADNFLTTKYIRDLIIKLTNNENAAFRSAANNGGKGGRIVVSKKHFFQFRGYEENLNGYGNEDTDFWLKCRINGLRQIRTNGSKCLRHSEDDRVKNYKADKSTTEFENINSMVLYKTLTNGQFFSNSNVSFGDGTVYKNFSSEPITLPKLEDHHVPKKLIFRASSNLDYEKSLTDPFFFFEDGIFIYGKKKYKRSGKIRYIYEVGKWNINKGNLFLDWFDYAMETLKESEDGKCFSNNHRTLTKVNPYRSYQIIIDKSA